jgi:hypothetical protein
MDMLKNYKNKSGATLVWALVTMLVLTLILAIVLTVVGTMSARTQTDRSETQAYYTATTVNTRIVNWLQNTLADPDADDEWDPLTETNVEQFNFINDTLILEPNRQVTFEYDEDDLGEGMGTTKTTITYVQSKTNDYTKDEIKVSTVATYHDEKEAVYAVLHPSLTQEINSVDTGFDYSDPDISNVLTRVGQVNDWAATAQYMAQPRYEWRSYFTVRASEFSGNYKMDLLAVSNAGNPSNGVYPATNDYNDVNGTTAHEYSYKYLRNLAALTDLKILLDESRGPFLISGTHDSNSYYPDPTLSDTADPNYAQPIATFPYATKKGNLISLSGSGIGYNVTHNPITYYTIDHPGCPYETTDITLILALQLTNNPVATDYENMHIYMTDTSEKKFYIQGGRLTISDGSIYTKRSAEFGGYFYDAGNTGSASYTSVMQNEDMVFQRSQLIFADPGENQSLRTSVMKGCGGSGKLRMNNGCILIQNNHQLSIQNGAIINANENKGIVVEGGGSLIIDNGAEVTADIYVASGGTLTINSGAFITGNIHVMGNLVINGNYTYNVTTPTDPTQGIFIYNDTNIGVGTLNFTNPTTDNYGNGRIHTFLPNTQLANESYNNYNFCDDRATNNVCEHWISKEYRWQADSTINRDTK